MSRRPSRRLIVVTAMVVLAFTTLRVLDQPHEIDAYRSTPDGLIVETTTGNLAWTRVTSVEEAAGGVTITVSSIWLQIGAGTWPEHALELPVELKAPLAGRRVIDGATGLAVPPAP